MMTLLGILLFSASCAVALGTIGAMIAPNLTRIGDALMGRPQAQFAPLTALVRAERRIAVRRWAATPRAATRMRAAA